MIFLLIPAYIVIGMVIGCLYYRFHAIPSCHPNTTYGDLALWHEAMEELRFSSYLTAIFWPVYIAAITTWLLLIKPLINFVIKPLAGVK